MWVTLVVRAFEKKKTKWDLSGFYLAPVLGVLCRSKGVFFSSSLRYSDRDWENDRVKFDYKEKLQVASREKIQVLREKNARKTPRSLREKNAREIPGHFEEKMWKTRGHIEKRNEEKC